MPGSRLTQQDRRHIAAGLADGLSYAGIARRLDRPTSTVTREVMRNGGPVGYRADRAHHEAGRRARRGGRGGTGSAPAAAFATDLPGRDGEAVRDYEKRLTEVLVAMGLPGMTARVLACIGITDSGCATVADLVQRLNVSPASVSKAVGYLEGQGLIRRECDARRRRDRYVIDNEMWFEAMMASVRLNALLVATARDGAAVLGPGTPAGNRLNDMAHLLEHVSHDLHRSIERWLHGYYARRAPHAHGGDNCDPTSSQ
ncbi:helix-turn-helix domain-containing protein [Streptomyces aureoversilis]|uniref:Helix-turn-helix domain-containing protein n=1 Tax=Streptomyces aureoversilis TaxID=67277 RepID=A0ABW0ACM8_9ACTN